MTSKLLTYEDLAEILSMSPSTLKTWASRKPESLPPMIKLGKSIRFHPDTVERWIKAKDAKGQKFYGPKA